MFRIKISLPKREKIFYNNLDTLHDALVNAFIKAGATADEVIGFHSCPWNFAALGWNNRSGSSTHALIVSTSDEGFSEYLKKIKVSDITYARVHTNEMVDFSAAKIEEDPVPLAIGQTTMGCLLLSPLVISNRENKKKKQWIQHIDDVDLSAVINSRLSKIRGENVCIKAMADKLYVRCNPKHDCLIPLKELKNGKRVFVIGMRVPLVLQGETKHLALCWYAGIGEKTKNGFGCLGLPDRGVGR